LSESFLETIIVLIDQKRVSSINLANDFDGRGMTELLDFEPQYIEYVFNEEIFSLSRTRVAPIICVLGFGLMIYAILVGVFLSGVILGAAMSKFFLHKAIFVPLIIICINLFFVTTIYHKFGRKKI